MLLGMEVGLGTGDFVLDRDPASLPKNGPEALTFGPCLLWPNGWMDPDALGMEVGLGPGHIVLDVYQLPSPKEAERPQFSADFYCGLTAG